MNEGRIVELVKKSFKPTGKYYNKEGELMEYDLSKYGVDMVVLGDKVKYLETEEKGKKEIYQDFKEKIMPLFKKEEPERYDCRFDVFN